MNKKMMFWSIWFIIIPLAISFLWLFPLWEKIEIPYHQDSLVLSETDLFKPSFRNSFRELFEVPFDLKWYNLCFKNNNSQDIYVFSKGIEKKRRDFL